LTGILNWGFVVMMVEGVQFVVALIAVLACALLVGCRPSNVERPLIVVVSGDTSGWIVPCGCTSNQSGGLPRRAAYVKQLRNQAETILDDVGGVPHGTSPYDRAKFEAILRGEMRMGIVAHNIGAGEAKLGPAELRRLVAMLDVPMLSANVRDRAGRLVAKPVRIQAAAGRRVALVGVLSERYATDELQIAPPRQAVLDALRDVAQQYDTAIVLAYLPEGELREFAEALPEADVVLGGPTGQPIAPQQVGPTLLASATNKGKFVVRLHVPALHSADHWTGGIVELNEQFADDSRQMMNVERFRADLADLDFAPSQTDFVEAMPADLPKGFAVAGTESCRKCHAEDCSAWRQSKHATAWNSLKAKGSHVDPECQRCHTTGYGLPGGFISAQRSQGTVDVGCESCHGPSQGHVTDSTVRTAHFAQARNHCTGCHDRENSPKFAYDAYWRSIEHGQKAMGNHP
jgi:hypothetical protein